jgi:hypothetical protein
MSLYQLRILHAIKLDGKLIIYGELEKTGGKAVVAYSIVIYQNSRRKFQENRTWASVVVELLILMLFNYADSNSQVA